MVALPYEMALLCQYLINKLEGFELNAAVVVITAPYEPQPFIQVQVEGEASCY